MTVRNTSIIVCTKDRAEDLARFIESVDLQTRLPDELIIVDASGDGLTQKLIQSVTRRARYKVKYTRAAPGLTRQRNIGVEMAGGDTLFLFDDDTVLEQDYVEIVSATFDKYRLKNVGGICGRITNISENRPFRDAMFRTFFFLTDRSHGRLKLSGFPAFRRGSKCAFVEVMPGNCMAYAKNVFKHFAFDENLTGYGFMEDVDFSYRVSKKFRLLYQPLARLAHYETTYTTVDSRKLKRMQIRNHFYLFKKNMAKGPFQIIGFTLSIAGLFLYSLLRTKDLRACQGVIDGLFNPLTQNDSSNGHPIDRVEEM